MEVTQARRSNEGWVRLCRIRERGYYVSGAGGALLVTIPTGVTLRRILSGVRTTTGTAQVAVPLSA